MADLLQPPDLTQFRAFTAGDEHALVTIYRTHYDALLDQARDALGPELSHFSGRVAQQAMLTTWDHRSGYENVAELTAALNGAICDEAALQRRKHVALHHGATNAAHAPHVSVPSADEAVDRLVAQLHTMRRMSVSVAGMLQAGKEPVVEASIVKDIGTHHAAAHVQSVGKGRGWVLPVALIAGVAVAIVAAMRWVGASGAEVAATNALQADNARNLSSARGQRGTVTLNDGSKARIGSDSKLRMPADFGGTIRTLELTGTAMFTVAPNRSQPFVVRAAHAVITATGTQFTVRAFEEDSSVYIGVDEGTVSVRPKDSRTETSLEAGKSMRLARDGSMQMLDDATRQLALEWVHDTLVFKDAPVKVVLPELIRWFDLKASLADKSLGERKVSLRIGLQSSGDALIAMAAAANLSVGFDKDDKVVLSDMNPTPPPAKGKP